MILISSKDQKSYLEAFFFLNISVLYSTTKIINNHPAEEIFLRLYRLGVSVAVNLSPMCTSHT